MTISMDLITGVSVGLEFVEPIPELEVGRTIIIDILIFRLILEF